MTMNPDEEMDQRKSRSEARLRALQVPICDWLPHIGSEQDVIFRSAADVARRGLILCAVSAYAQGYYRDRIIPWLKNENLWQHISPQEEQFFLETHSDSDLCMKLSWRIEGMAALLWALGNINALDWPDKTCDVGDVVSLIPPLGNPTGDFVNRAAYRPKTEILDQIDLYYRLHWAVVDATLKNMTMPADVNGAVVYEQRYALEWLIYEPDPDFEDMPDNETWDDVPMDT